MDKLTTQQQKALFKYFELVAEALNDAGFDMKKTLKESIDIPWNKDRVKQFLWAPIQSSLFHTESTKDLDTHAVDRVFETLNRHTGEKFGVSMDFPHIEDDLPIWHRK